MSRSTTATRATPRAWSTNDQAALGAAAKQHEFASRRLFQAARSTFTAAHFQIIQTNLSTRTPPSTPIPRTNQPKHPREFSATAASRFELKGGLTKELSIVASYTSKKLRDPLNRRPRNIATHAGLLSPPHPRGSLKNLGGSSA